MTDRLKEQRYAAALRADIIGHGMPERYADEAVMACRDDIANAVKTGLDCEHLEIVVWCYASKLRDADERAARDARR